MFKKTILTLACFSFASLSSAGEWHFLGDVGSSSSAIDMSSITTEGEDIVGGWMLTVLNNKKVSHFMSWQQTNCKKKMLRADEYIFYSYDGETIKTIKRSEEWQRVVPDTVGEELYNCMCGNAKINLVKMPHSEFAKFLRIFLEESKNTK